MDKSLKVFVDARAQPCDHGSHSEYVRHLVRRDEEALKIERLRDLIAEGLASPPARPWPEIRADLRRQLTERGR